MTLMLHKPLVSSGLIHLFALSFSISFSNPAFPYVSFRKLIAARVQPYLCGSYAPNIVLFQLLLSSDFLN